MRHVPTARPQGTLKQNVIGEEMPQAILNIQQSDGFELYYV